ncbi:flagellar basal body-associated protein FliL [Alcanivorax sp. 24]|uniref:flagellar basal body-associated protein FliL n=1 Tax=Alcanivorax sp. 24 TaxID=2545266 RepID=UPI0014151FA2|nr:flagellar basal body-associated protein FliL [Alcanivorax sp. 24]
MAEKKGSRKLVWLIAALLVMTTSLAAANVYLLMDKSGDSKLAAKVVQTARSPIYVKVDPFTVNLRDDFCGRHLLYAGISLQVGDSTTEDFLNDFMPQVRSRLLLLTSGQKAGEMMTPEGKAALIEKILALFEKELVSGQPTLRVDDVLFTEFIVQ